MKLAEGSADKIRLREEFGIFVYFGKPGIHPQCSQPISAFPAKSLSLCTLGDSHIDQKIGLGKKMALGDAG